MAQPTALEQLQLELINRARANPNAEAARLGIGLNDGVSGPPISSSSKSPLAFSLTLNDAGDAHTADMINQDYFDHRGLNGSTPASRAFAAGWQSDGFGYSIGENIAWIGSTNPSSIFTESRTQSLHDNLFRSGGHRTNILGEGYSEIGIGIGGGSFTDPRDGRTWAGTSMVTQVYADGGRTFLTGVVIDDQDNDDFYDIGEGLGNVTVRATGSAGTFTTVSSASGGYSLELPDGNYSVTFSGGALGATVTRSATIGSENVKLDVEKSDGPVITTITGTAAGDILTGTAGDDSILAGAGADTVRAKGGNDVISGGTGSDTIHAEAGNDKVFAGTGNDVVYGGQGADLLRGDDGNDRLHGDDNSDTLIGGDGADTMYAGAGNDRAFGGNGSDTIRGGIGDDDLRGNAGNDRIYGDSGNDRLHGNGENDMLFGGIGSDAIFGGAGNDAARGGDGSDFIRGGTGNDDLRGNDGNDRIFGDAGDDRLYGQGDDDRLYGDAGNDQIYGEIGDDILKGGSGNNVLNGGTGSDRALYDGAQAAYTITTNASGATTIVGLGVSDLLVNIELASFADGVLVL